MVRDRRSGNERRDILRYAAQIEIEWESLVGTRVGTVSDLSRTGCFVLCSGEVEDGENVKLIFYGEACKTIVLWGAVVYHVYEIGFAVRFIELGETETSFLENLLENLNRATLHLCSEWRMVNRE